VPIYRVSGRSRRLRIARQTSPNWITASCRGHRVIGLGQHGFSHCTTGVVEAGHTVVASTPCATSSTGLWDGRAGWVVRSDVADKPELLMVQPAVA